ncbi:MAG: Na+/H+ antiporter subunit E [Candidatus Brocadiia bacterium]
MKKVAFFFLLLATWLLLTWSLDPQDAFAGVVFSLLLAAALGRIYPKAPERLLHPRRWLWFFLYIPYFIYYCVRANLDVAYRVLHAHVPIRPGIVRVRTELQSDLAKTFLANSITLTPGTLTVDIEGQDLYVHWINITSDDPQEQTESIVKRFERMLKEIFE